MPETISPMHECYEKLGRPQDMYPYLTRLMERYGWITATLTLADIKEKEEGTHEAIDFISERLRHRASVRGLDRLLQLELRERGEDNSGHARMLKDLTTELLHDRPVYKCQHCGFPAKSLHWQCPSCKHWNSIRPIQGVEGE